ncbi:MAG: hypothetical protein C4527_27630 [Candidatus Omnitrophota bacterium]|jgi:hypothetical protein|nr:MAG: hypothetical protein C4527_27630 [Candidatus Omnitrophota bacterium]
MESMTTVPSFWTGPTILAIEITVIVLIIVVGYFLIRRKSKITSPPRATKWETDSSLQDLIDATEETSSSGQKIVRLRNISYTLENELNISEPVQLHGEGVNQTKIVAKGKQPAIRIQNTKNCMIEGMRVEGAVQCTNGELKMENCHIVANNDGVCIEAADGASVIFSGMISGGAGGIAIRARGESQVILKPPYKVAGEDYVIVDPKSKITLEEQEKKSD